jgi:hypothetical protein
VATQAEVRKRALRKLGLASTSQAPTSDLDSDMQEAYTETYTMLERQSQTFWGESLDVPDEIANHLAALMAFTRANDYGIGTERYQRLAAERTVALREFRMMAVNEYNSSDDPEDF